MPLNKYFYEKSRFQTTSSFLNDVLDLHKCDFYLETMHS